MNEKIEQLYRDAINEDLQPNVFANEVLGLFGVIYCASQMKNVLCNRFRNEAKKHVGKNINEVPELAELLNAIKIVEKHCSERFGYEALCSATKK